MPVHNADIAAIFDEIADLLEIRDDNPFRIRAYRNAARIVSGYGREFKTLIESGTALPKLPGIGADLAAKIHEIVTTGHCAMLDALRQQMPPAITELLKVPGLGPKRVQALNRELGVSTIAQLDAAAHAGQIHDVPGFGLKTEQHIQQALDALAAQAGQAVRFRRPQATQYAAALVAYLQRVPGVEQVVVAGSYRRMKDTVGDLDILVTAEADSALMARFIAYDEVQTVLAHGETRSSVVLHNGLQVDLRLVPADSYGAALHYFTGSKAHNIAIRRIAQELGLKINEYGVFRGAQRVAGATEESVFAAVGLPFIVPELREDRGEIQAARAGRLPQLVTLADLRGDLHVHTKASDGHNTIAEMARAAQAQGLEYIAITDHSRRLTVAHGLDPQQLLRQIDEIDRINASAAGITILKGIEVDILEDGTLDLPDSVLQQLDIVIAAVHSNWTCRASARPNACCARWTSVTSHILAHPTGRLLGVREPSDIDMLRIMRKAKSRHIASNSTPSPSGSIWTTHCARWRARKACW